MFRRHQHVGWLAEYLGQNDAVLFAAAECLGWGTDAVGSEQEIAQVADGVFAFAVDLDVLPAVFFRRYHAYILGLLINRLCFATLATYKKKQNGVRMHRENRMAYWRANLRLVALCLAFWFLCSYGFGVLFVDQLNQVRIA